MTETQTRLTGPKIAQPAVSLGAVAVYRAKAASLVIRVRDWLAAAPERAERALWCLVPASVPQLLVHAAVAAGVLVWPAVETRIQQQPRWQRSIQIQQAQGPEVCNIVTTVCTGPIAGSGFFTAATCSGLGGDDSAAFASFNVWAVSTFQAAHPNDTIELDTPNGGICYFKSNGPGLASGSCAGGLNCPFTGLKHVLAVCLGYVGQGDGCTWTDNAGAGKGFVTASGGKGPNQSGGICYTGIWETVGTTGLDGCSARIATANAGDTCVTVIPGNSGLSVATLIARFVVGRWIFVGAIDAQPSFAGAPTNEQFYEYRQITSVDSAHNCDGVTAGGSVRFAGGLARQYKSTWPSFNVGNSASGTPDEGGPATIWQMQAEWDTEVEYRGITIDQTDGQTQSQGRSVTYTNVKFTGGGCPYPSQNVLFKVFNGDLSTCGQGSSGWEVDKLNVNVLLDTVTIYRIQFQSPSPDVFTFNNSTNTSGINGTPKKFSCTNSTISSFAPGTIAYGVSTETDLLSNCNVASLSAGGYTDGTVNLNYQMVGGVIKMPVAQNVTAEAKCAANNDVCVTVTTSAGWVAGMNIYVSLHNGAACSGDIPAGNYTVNAIPDGTHIDLAGTTFASGTPGGTCQVQDGNILSFPPSWIVPGANLFFTGGFSGGAQEAPKVFQVLDVSLDSTFVNVMTSLPGGFPAYAGQNINITPHGAPVFRCNGCIGAGVSWLPGHPDGAPLGSYASTTLTLANSSLFFPVWGTLKSLTFAVNTISTGSSPSVDIGSGGVFVINPAASAKIIWSPSANPKLSGTRFTTPTATTGAQSGDVLTCSGGPGPANTNPGCPAAIWLLSDQVTAELLGLAGGDPVSVTVTINTDQGVVVPAAQLQASGGGAGNFGYTPGRRVRSGQGQPAPRF